MAKSKINFDDMLGDRTILFNDNTSDSNKSTDTKETNTTPDSKEKTSDSKKTNESKETVTKTDEKKVKSSNNNLDFITNIINQRNEIFIDKSINQVKINNKTKDVLDRLKFISEYPISNLADAIILDFYLKNEAIIIKLYKNKIKNDKLF